MHNLPGWAQLPTPQQEVKSARNGGFLLLKIGVLLIYNIIIYLSTDQAQSLDIEDYFVLQCHLNIINLESHGMGGA